MLDVISVDTTPDRIVDTLKFPPAEYVPSEIELFRVLRGMVREGLGTGNIELLGKAATASAEINERFLLKPGLHEIKRIGDLHGAAGVQVAHSGTVVGLMFDPKQPSRDEIGVCCAPVRKFGLRAHHHLHYLRTMESMKCQNEFLCAIFQISRIRGSSG
ncbi:hypothetical protein LZK73_28335 (plasmid) [Neorhizobium galegae]|nr:hypothetical protein LZK73_28335 [Neorhizobium galegae]